MPEFNTPLSRLISLSKFYPDARPAEKEQLYSQVPEILSRVMPLLLSDNPAEVKEVEQLLSSETEFAKRLRKDVTLFYKNKCELLEQGAMEAAKALFIERTEILEEVDLDDPGKVTNAHKFKAAHNLHDPEYMLESNDHDLNILHPDTKEHNSNTAALKRFWASMKESDTLAPVEKNQKNEEDWMSYRDRLKNGLAELSKPENAILLKENNPITSFLKDVCNSVFKYFGYTPFEAHKNQQSFKTAIAKVREQTGVEEKKVDEQPSFGK